MREWTLTLVLIGIASLSAQQWEGRNLSSLQGRSQRQAVGNEYDHEQMESEKNSQAEYLFDELLTKQNRAAPEYTAQPQEPEQSPLVTVDLEEYDRLRKQVNALAERRNQASGPAVILGASEYVGKEVGGNLSLRLRLHVTLGRKGVWKTVPLVGDDVVLVSAHVNNRPIPVSRAGKYHVWVTDGSGEAEVVADIIVASRGPRGSIEFDFMSARTPATQFTCDFPVEGLEPRLTTALQAHSQRIAGGTRFTATLKPTSRIHLIGFKEMAGGDRLPAKVYAETMNLLSIDENALELFSVFYYTILYSGAQKFDIFIPEGLKVVSADGRGAFHYALEQSDGGVLLRGETEFPIRNRFEISLRLRREMKKTGEAFEVPLPRCGSVERESGWLGVEVPGKLQLQENQIQEMQAIDMRQLPEDLVRSAVGPILKAYRYHSPQARLRLHAARLPVVEPSQGSIDDLQAVTTIMPEGTQLTELRITLRNRLRHTINLDLPAEAEVISAMIDGEPLKVSRNEMGAILLPLKRSQGDEQLVPFTVSIVTKRQKRKMPLLGQTGLELPVLDLPVSSLKWSVYAPATHTYSRLRGDIRQQRRSGQATWYQPQAAWGHGYESVDAFAAIAADRPDGALSVEFNIPLTGKELVYRQYWVPEGRPVKVDFWSFKSSLLIPIRIVLIVLIAAGLFAGLLSSRRGAMPKVVTGGVAVFAAGLISGFWVGPALVPWTGILIGVAGSAVHLGVLRRLKAWWSRRSAPEGHGDTQAKLTSAQMVKGGLRLAVFATILLIFLGVLFAFVNLVANRGLPG